MYFLVLISSPFSKRIKMMISLQNVSQDEVSITYQYEIRGKWIQVQVSQEEYENWDLGKTMGEELQGLLETIRYQRLQQRLLDLAGGSGQQQYQRPSTMAASTTAVVANATMDNADSIPTRPPLPPRTESMTTQGIPQHSSTPMNATSRHSEVTSPISRDQELEDRTARIEEKEPPRKRIKTTSYSSARSF